MGKINILSSEVFNRIAAGEVIDRPYSVVKELVENSIDAGAKKITVEIVDGGLSSIVVTDDGEGILKEDLKAAILPHATSKISAVNDLDDISTLGFRGEALASIASVSKFTIESLKNGEDLGGKLYAEGGKVIDLTDSVAAKGTRITVKNLFFNAPVRAKFLRSVRAEEGEIYSTVARFILGNPDIAFTLSADGKTQLQSFGDGIESAFLAVYGVDYINKCFFVESEKNGIKLCGYIGKHDFTKSNRTYQTVFLNKRYILNQTVASAISNAYAPYMMKRQYPFYFLTITMPSNAVDVNVHPNKTDVRFLSNQVVYSSIYSIISKVLDGSKEVLDIVKTQNLSEGVAPKEEYSFSPEIAKNREISTENTVDYVSHNQGLFGKPKSSPFDKVVFCDSGAYDEDKLQPEVDIFAENKKYIEEIEKKRESANEQLVIPADKTLKVIGQALNTYLVLEDGVDMFFIDQHAAHERLLFDKITAAYKSGKVIEQPLLIPIIINVNPTEAEFLEAKADFFKSIGFTIECFGKSSYQISSVPAYLTELDVKKFFNDVFLDINLFKTLTLDSVLFDKLAQKACKSAIKSGDKLSDNEIDALLTALNGNLALKCPHGRPIAVKISRTEIDKWFKRIV